MTINLDLDSEKWSVFKEACKEEGKNPDQVIQKLIDGYTIENSPEYHLAQGMIEAEKILEGKLEGIDAHKLLDEI